MEVLPGVHQIRERLGQRWLSLYLLVGERVLLVDTGLATTPEATLFPYLRQIGLSADAIDYVVVTHADCDHSGGNATLRAAAPHAVFVAHERDVAWIEQPDRLCRERYQAYADLDGIAYSAEVQDWLRSMAGSPCRIDFAVRGWETVALADDWQVTLLPTPGETPGHLALIESRYQAAIVGDAVMGSFVPDVDGHPSLPPTYVRATAYRTTTQTLAVVRPTHLLSAHYPVFRGEAVGEFLAASHDFVSRADRVVRALLAEAAAPLTLREINELANPLLGPFPMDAVQELAYPLESHLAELVAAGVAETTSANGRRAWRLTPAGWSAFR